jgi:hypothetical protein
MVMGLKQCRIRVTKFFVVFTARCINVVFVLYRLTGRDGQIMMYVMTSESTKQPTLGKDRSFKQQ